MFFRLFLVGFLFFAFVSNHALGQSASTLFFNNSIVELSKISSLLNQFSLPSVELSKQKFHYYVVQYEGARASDVRKYLDTLGHVARYVPDNAFILKYKGLLSAVQHHSNIVSVFPYGPYLKIEKSLLEGEPNHVLFVDVHLFASADHNSVLNQLARFSKIEQSTGSSVIKVQTSLGAISKIALIEGVEWIDRSKKVVVPMMDSREFRPAEIEIDLPNADRFAKLNGYASGAKVLNPDRLYELGIRGQGETVAYADSGLDTGNFETLVEDVRGRVNQAVSLGRSESGRWDDPSGHGTHIAGLIAGNGLLSNGHVRGVAFESGLFVQSAFREEGFKAKLVLPSDIGELFREPYEQGARVHSNSWTYTVSHKYGIQDASVDRFIWKNPDMVVVVAAGNSGADFNQDGRIDEGSMGSPGNAKNCITVGASENLIPNDGLRSIWFRHGRLAKQRFSVDPIRSDFLSDNINGIAALSSRGPTFDGRIKPDLVAPGTNNLSLKSRAISGHLFDKWRLFNEDYVFMGGTSMAAPLVAGAAALVRQFYREVEKREYVSSALVKATLINGAKELFPGQFADFKEIPKPKPNFHEGFGRVDLEAALISDGARHRISIDDQKGVREGFAKDWYLRVLSSDEPLRVTLVYNDFPASPSVFKSLVNNLDLIVLGEEETRYPPNGLKHKTDDINNVEHVEIAEPALGNYRVRIYGKSIPMGVDGRQPFALVLSGAVEMVYED